MPEPPGLIRVRGWLDRHRWTCAIVAVTLLAGGLRLHALGRVPSNPFYDAAVRSMLHSWHNFFFGAFEPSGRVSIDKPPIDLWAQVISVKLFGFTSVALKLPQAIAGTLTVPLLYDLARRAFGRYAGLTSAIAYAVLPLAVVTARSDTMDSLMAAIVVLAAWLIVIAAQHERPRLLFLAAAVMGVAFNVKLFEALVALPAIVVLYYLATRAAIPHRARRLAIAAAIFVVTALSWVTLASLGPSNSAPFPIGSTDGTVFNVVFVYDGIDRLKGKPQPLKANRRRARGRRGNSVSRRLEVDHPGLTRLFVNSGAGYGRPLGSELLPALLFGGVAVILAIIETLRWHVRRYRLSSAAAIAIAVWLLTGFVLFSSSGALHARYLEAFTPAIALALGAGVASLALRAARRTAPLLGLLAMLAVSTLYEYDLTSNTPHVRQLLLALALMAGVTTIAARAGRDLRGPGWVRARRVLLPGAFAATLACVFVVPTITAARLASAGASDSGLPGVRSPSELAALTSYLKAHQGRAKYELAVYPAALAGPVIVHDDRPVLVLGTIKRQLLVTADQLAAAVRAGEVRYALLKPVPGARCNATGTPAPAVGGKPRADTSAVRWARMHGADVSRQAGLDACGQLYHLTRGAAHS